MMAFFGAVPLGSLLAGSAAALDRSAADSHRDGHLLSRRARSGSRSKLPELRAIMRPIYREMGLLPAADFDLIPDAQEPPS